MAYRSLGGAKPLEFIPRERDHVMIGDRRFQGKGYGYMIYDLLLKYAFEVLKLRKVTGGCNVKNIGMQKIFRKKGYAEEGRFRGVDWVEGEWCDHIYYGIFKKEYEEQKNTNSKT